MGERQRYILFGAGEIGERVYQRLKGDILAVIDNSPEKIGKTFHGLPIISLAAYKSEALYRKSKILISTARAAEIEQQLTGEGILNYKLSGEFFEDPNVHIDLDIIHEKWPIYLQKLCDKPGYDVLEVGSRVVTGDRFRQYFQKANYTGFDYYTGENVDVVGDAHELSSYFDKKFDLIFSSAVFEHFAMPWRVSLEMIKLLKPGGYVFIETHFAQGRHEMPWHFFHFTENALDVLFPQKFGMECVKKSSFNLLEGRFSEESAEVSEYLRGRTVGGLYCHTEYLGQKVADVPIKELSWDHIHMKDVVYGTTYPSPKE